MKTQRNFFLAMTVILFSCFSVYANNTIGEGKLIVKIGQANYNAIKVQLANLHNQRTELRITDTNGKLWYKELIVKEVGYAMKFDLSVIPEGNYILFVKNKTDKCLEGFAKNDTGISFFQDEEDYQKNKNLGRLVSGTAPVSNPMITKFRKTADQKITVQLANLLKAETSIRLNAVHGTCLLKDKVDHENAYSKKLNLAGMSNGDYYFLVKNKDTVVIQFFTLDDNEVTLDSFQRLDPGQESGKLTSK